jgi:hypothetical protein
VLDRHAYQNAVRARLLAAYEGGAIMANIAVAMNPPATAAELYRFKRGEPWGVTRLARLVAVLDQLDQAAPTSSPPPPPAVEVPEGRPTDRAPPPDHEGQADDSQPAGPAPQPGPAQPGPRGVAPGGDHRPGHRGASGPARPHRYRSAGRCPRRRRTEPPGHVRTARPARASAAAGRPRVRPGGLGPEKASPRSTRGACAAERGEGQQTDRRTFPTTGGTPGAYAPRPPRARPLHRLPRRTAPHPGALSAAPISLPYGPAKRH